jgi:trigger factor
MDHVGRDIPEPIKREVRQKCGFGCVICGKPIWQYDHIEEFADVQEHKLDNIVLLCPDHHADKTSGRLSKEVIRRFAAAPANVGKDETAPYRPLMLAQSPQVEIGSNVWEWQCDPTQDGEVILLMIANVRIVGLALENGFLLLNVLFKDHSGNVILEIDRGEMKVSTGVWDYRFEGRLLTINSAARHISLQMQFSERGVNIVRGAMSLPPNEVKISSSGVSVVTSGRPVFAFSGDRYTIQGQFATCLVINSDTSIQGVATLNFLKASE